QSGHCPEWLKNLTRALSRFMISHFRSAFNNFVARIELPSSHRAIDAARAPADCGKPRLNCQCEDEWVIKLNGGGLLPPHPPPHSQTAAVTRRPADSPAPSVSS